MVFVGRDVGTGWHFGVTFCGRLIEGSAGNDGVGTLDVARYPWSTASAEFSMPTSQALPDEPSTSSTAVWSPAMAAWNQKRSTSMDKWFTRPRKSSATEEPDGEGRRHQGPRGPRRCARVDCSMRAKAPGARSTSLTAWPLSLPVLMRCCRNGPSPPTEHPPQ